LTLFNAVEGGRNLPSLDGNDFLYRSSYGPSLYFLAPHGKRGAQTAAAVALFFKYHCCVRRRETGHSLSAALEVLKKPISLSA
jgi:hypothetical protein